MRLILALCVPLALTIVVNAENDLMLDFIYLLARRTFTVLLDVKVKKLYMPRCCIVKMCAIVIGIKLLNIMTEHNSLYRFVPLILIRALFYSMYSADIYPTKSIYSDISRSIEVVKALAFSIDQETLTMDYGNMRRYLAILEKETESLAASVGQLDDLTSHPNFSEGEYLQVSNVVMSVYNLANANKQKAATNVQLFMINQKMNAIQEMIHANPQLSVQHDLETLHDWMIKMPFQSLMSSSYHGHYIEMISHKMVTISELIECAS